MSRLKSSMLGWLNAVRRRPILLSLSLLLLVAAMLVLGLALRSLGQRLSDPRNLAFLNWAQADSESRVELITVQREPCPGAPFILPADGFIGLLYGDPRGPYSQSRPHQGIDIFSDTDPGVTPVYAAYDGYVTRESGWRSSLIMRVPEDPLDEERQIWLYYTHMADRQGNDFIEPQFSPGTRELFVERGTLLGYTGNYNGSSARGVWVHLHFSIVQDNGSGGYLNELEFENSLDPSPYLGMNVGYECQAGSPDCGTTPECVAP